MGCPKFRTPHKKVLYHQNKLTFAVTCNGLRIRVRLIENRSAGGLKGDIRNYRLRPYTERALSVKPKILRRLSFVIAFELNCKLIIQNRNKNVKRLRGLFLIILLEQVVGRTLQNIAQRL